MQAVIAVLPSVVPVSPSSSKPAVGRKVSDSGLPTSLAKTAAPPSVPQLPSASDSLSQKVDELPAQLSTCPEQTLAFSNALMAVAADAALPETVSIQDHPVGLQQQGASMTKLRSITTPAQQLRQKDEQIATLQSTVEDLQHQLAAAEQLKAVCVSSAIESTKASLEQDLRSRASKLSTAHAELEACKASAELRERQHQVKTHSMLANVTIIQRKT